MNFTAGYDETIHKKRYDETFNHKKEIIRYKESIDSYIGNQCCMMVDPRPIIPRS